MKRFVLAAATVVLLSTTANAQGRPPGCPHAWCGCYLSLHIFGKNIRELWRATAWLKFKRTTPHAGAVAVMRHHVGKVIDANGNTITLLSGNHNHAVGIGVYPRSRIIAYVDPR